MSQLCARPLLNNMFFIYLLFKDLQKKIQCHKQRPHCGKLVRDHVFFPPSGLCVCIVTLKFGATMTAE